MAAQAQRPAPRRGARRRRRPPRPCGPSWRATNDNIQARQRLVADASHELRAPLAAMGAELDVTLAQERLDPSARAALLLARDDAVRLTRIVENLLTLARVDEGRLELLIAPHDLSELADRAARAQRAAASARRIDVVIDGDEVVAGVDGDRLEQVLTNLLDNAIRHARHAGRVSLDIHREATETRITVGTHSHRRRDRLVLDGLSADSRTINQRVSSLASLTIATAAAGPPTPDRQPNIDAPPSRVQTVRCRPHPRMIDSR